jgi:Protein of unknown function (DUF2384)
VIDGMNAFDLARVCQVDAGQAQAWLDLEEQPSAVIIARLRVVKSVMDGLAKNGLSAPEDRVEWLRNPNRAFGHEAPIDLLSRGETKPVLDYIARLS